MELRSCLYDCSIMHHRLSPVRHRFSYASYFFYLDLDGQPIVKIGADGGLQEHPVTSEVLLITAGGLHWQSLLARHGARYATITGKGYRPRPMDLGRWRYAAGAFFVLYALLVVGLPLLVPVSLSRSVMSTLPAASM